MITRMLPFCAAVAALWLVVLFGPAEAQVPAVPTNKSQIDPQADQVLRQMAEFYNSLKSASVEITTEYQGEWGPHGPNLMSKVMTFSVAVQRPDRYASRLTKGKTPLQWIISDGVKTASYRQFSGYTVEHRPFERSEHSRRLPKGVAALGEWLLMDKDLYESIMKPVKGSQYIGLENTEEGAYHHLKFFEEKGTFLVEGDFTWDLWVQSGQEPLVHRVVIVPSQKRLTYTEPPIIFETLEKITKTFSNWKVNPDLPQETFVIPPPPKEE
jgi:outer membrane lipoprotein-sorting protein